MSTLLAYIAEHFLVHLPYLALTCLGFYALRFGRTFWGIVLLSIFVLSLIGTGMEHGIDSPWPFIDGAAGIVIAEILGRIIRRRRQIA
jgi:uncharacterized membrane protein YccC